MREIAGHWMTTTLGAALMVGGLVWLGPQRAGTCAEKQCRTGTCLSRCCGTEQDRCCCITFDRCKCEPPPKDPAAWEDHDG